MQLGTAMALVSLLTPRPEGGNIGFHKSYLYLDFRIKSFLSLKIFVSA